MLCRSHRTQKKSLKGSESALNFFLQDVSIKQEVSQSRKTVKLELKGDESGESVTYDRPDLVSLSDLAQSTKQEHCRTVAQVKEEKQDYSWLDETMDMILASDFLETDLKEKQNGKDFVPQGVVLRTDKILGHKILKKGPEKIGGNVETDKSEFKIRCHMCNKQFSTKFAFNSHIKHLHNIQKECLLQCKYCPQQSRTMYNLKYHMLMFHLDELNFKTKWYRCSQCSLKTKDYPEIERHRDDVHQGAALLLFYTCIECPFQTDRVSKLQGHVKLHFRPGTLKCPYCSFKCTKSCQKLINEHLLLHKR